MRFFEVKAKDAKTKKNTGMSEEIFEKLSSREFLSKSKGVKSFKGDEIHVWLLHVSKDLYLEAKDLLSAEEKEQLSRIKLKEESFRYGIAHGILRKLLCFYLEREFAYAAEIPVFKDEKGKPYTDGCKFNISHSGDFVVLAFAKDKEVGVDVEHLRHKEMKPHFVDRILHDKERKIYENMDTFYGISREEYIIWKWTQKEAVLKTSGVGIRIPLHSLNIVDELADDREYPLISKGRLEDKKNQEAGTSWKIFTYRLSEESFLTVSYMA